MRILVVSDLPQFVTGGAEVQASRLIEAWLNAGHEVICIGRRMPSGSTIVGRHRLRVRRIHSLRGLGRFARAATYALSLMWLLLTYRKWADVIYTRFLAEAAITAAVLKRFRMVRVPLVATPANARGSGDVKFLRSVPCFGSLVRLLDRNCDAINLIAEGMVDDLIEAGFSGDNFHYIPNGIPIGELEARPAASPPSFLAVGRLVPQKGYDILLRALAEIPDLVHAGQIRIAGGGPESSSLASLATTLGVADRVQWLGEQTPEQVTKELESAQVFLLPSRYEGLSNAGLEAMERGLPVILTECGGLDRYISGRAGWVVPREDEKALAQALCEAISAGPSALMSMGACARMVVKENFEMLMVADRYIALFAQLCGRGSDKQVMAA